MNVARRSSKEFFENSFDPSQIGCGSYVYLHRKASDMTIFYVGKGKGRRAWVHSDRGSYWRRVAAKYGVFVEIAYKDIPELCALTIEKVIIKNIGLQNLINFTAGGEGLSGFKFSEESIRKKSKSLKIPIWNDLGERFDSSTDAAIAMRKRGHPRASHSAISWAAKGNNGNYTAYGHSWSIKGTAKAAPIERYKTRGSYKAIPIRCESSGLNFISLKAACRYVSENYGIKTANKVTMKNHINRGCFTIYGLKWSLIQKDQLSTETLEYYFA